MNDERDEIRRRIDLVDLVSQRVKLKRSGKNFLGLCPFHDDKTPSFNVSSSTGRYKCFACGESGDAFTWVMKTQGLEFIEALKQLADVAGVTLTLKQSGPKIDKTDRERWLGTMQAALIYFVNELSKSPPTKDYLNQRQLPEDVVREWELGYAPNIGDALTQQLQRNGHSLSESKDLFLVEKDSHGGYYDKFRGRLMFPIRDERGDLVGFGGRILGEGHPKYINSSETPLYHKSRVLYGMHRAKDRIMKDRHAVLVEGYLDVIACHRAGVTTAVASCGTALAEDQVRLIKRYADKVTILYDADNAGQKAAQRAVELFQAASLSCRVALMPQGEDPDTLLNKKGPQAVQEAVETSMSPFDFEVFLLEKRLGSQNEEFWKELPKLLATAQSELELEKHLLRLAGQHPEIKNATAATSALRREVSALRVPTGNRKRAPKGPLNVAPTVKNILPAEAVVLRTLLDDKLRPVVWNDFFQDNFMISSFASELRDELITIFGTNGPVGGAKVWLDQLDQDKYSQFFVDLDFDVRVQELNSQYISEAISQLRAKSNEQKLDSTRSQLDESNVQDLAAYFERLRKAKGIDGTT